MEDRCDEELSRRATVNKGDYEIEIIVRNGRIRQLMKAAGFKTNADLSRASGEAQSRIGEILNMTKSPMCKSGEWRLVVIRMAEALKCLPDDMFTVPQLKGDIGHNRRKVLVSEYEVEAITATAEKLAIPPDVLFDSKEVSTVVERVLVDNLTPREAKIINMRYGLGGGDGKTLVEIGSILRITSCRVQQIEAKAIRKLRHPSRKNQLKEVRVE